MTSLSVILDNAKQTKVECGTVLRGLYAYYSTGEADQDNWTSLLNLHCNTNGRATERLARFLRVLRPARAPTAASGVLGTFSAAKIKNIADVIARDGFYVFEERVSDEMCDELERFAERTPAMLDDGPPDKRAVFDAENPVCKRYRIPPTDMVANSAMQQLMADPVFLSVAEQYIRTQPILSGIGLWLSPKFGDTPGDDAAQTFHFDYDGAPKWLKCFVYLTDVGPKNGPHVFVRGSHVANNPAAEAILRRGYVRISDEEIEKTFGADNVVEICGRRGTVLVADTRGFHKGKMPESGHRVLAQLFYCPPFFNVHGPRQPLPPDIHPALAASMKAAPRIFERFPRQR